MLFANMRLKTSIGNFSVVPLSSGGLDLIPRWYPSCWVFTLHRIFGRSQRGFWRRADLKAARPCWLCLIDFFGVFRDCQPLLSSWPCLEQTLNYRYRHYHFEQPLIIRPSRRFNPLRCSQGCFWGSASLYVFSLEGYKHWVCRSGNSSASLSL